MKPKCNVYIDGYNWYHAVFKLRPEWKWLDSQRFFEVLRPNEEIKSVKLFSAIVNESIPGDPAKERHEKLIRAWRSFSKSKVILGKFQNREVTCRGHCRQKYEVPEEKKTDVNIAVEILSDAFFDECDSIVLVSGDSDAQPPIQWMKRRKPEKSVTVYIPAMPQERASRRLDFYKGIGVDCRFLPLDSMSYSQMPDTIKLSNGDIVCRPSCWS